MAKIIDIAALAEEVLGSVSEPETTKTASENVETKTDIGLALKEAASTIRNINDSEITSEDLRVFIDGVKEAMGLPIPNATAPGGVQQDVVGSETPNLGGGPGAPSTGGLPTGAPKMASSELGEELRKLANHVRVNGSASEEKKMIKAAQMISAAVGLKHFLEDSK